MFTKRAFKNFGLGLIAVGGLTLAGTALITGYMESKGYMRSNDLTDPIALSVAGLSIASLFTFNAGLNIYEDNRYRSQNERP